MDLPNLDDARRLRDGAQQLVDRAVERARELTSGGRDIDLDPVTVGAGAMLRF